MAAEPAASSQGRPGCWQHLAAHAHAHAHAKSRECSGRQPPAQQQSAGVQSNRVRLGIAPGCAPVRCAVHLATWPPTSEVSSAYDLSPAHLQVRAAPSAVSGCCSCCAQPGPRTWPGPQGHSTQRRVRQAAQGLTGARLHFPDASACTALPPCPEAGARGRSHEPVATAGRDVLRKGVHRDARGLGQPADQAVYQVCLYRGAACTRRRHGAWSAPTSTAGQHRLAQAADESGRGRRRDPPATFSRRRQAQGTPTRAIAGACYRPCFASGVALRRHAATAPARLP